MTDLTIFNRDIRLAASVYGPQAAPNVLCLHGITNSRDTWEETVNRLQDRFRVWTMDFRGHGHSDRAAPDCYLIPDYVSDAQAMLDFIGKPTVIIGHSLGGNVATVLAQQGHARLVAVLLEDPASYLNSKQEYGKTYLKKAFPYVMQAQKSMHEKNAPLADWLQYCRNMPDHRGGVAEAHFDERHLLSQASALQRHDPKSWTPIVDCSCFTAMQPDLPLQVPATVLRADHRYGPTFLPEYAARFLASNPNADVLEIEGASHRMHSSKATQARFLDLAEAFVQRHAVAV